MHILLTSILLFLSLQIKAQSGDFILLKKKSITIKTYFKGSQIEFITKRGAYRNAIITDIRNDSVFLKEYIINRLPISMGFYITDTLGSYHYAYHYQEIYRFNRPNKKFNASGSCAALMGGGLLLTLASAFVFVADKDNFSPPLLAAAVGLGTIGYFLNKKVSKGIIIGKNKFSLQYINISDIKNETKKR